MKQGGNFMHACASRAVCKKIKTDLRAEQQNGNGKKELRLGAFERYGLGILQFILDILHDG